ncbi:MAG: hypothetical protein ACFFAS_04385 [Promethearchaeota archaeon]
MSEDKAGKFIEKLNESFSGFVSQVFGNSGKDFIEETSKKIKEFSSTSIKKFIEFADGVLEKLNLQNNEQVMKARDSVEDMLKQAGFLEEEDENDF